MQTEDFINELSEMSKDIHTDSSTGPEIIIIASSVKKYCTAFHRLKWSQTHDLPGHTVEPNETSFFYSNPILVSLYHIFKFL